METRLKGELNRAGPKEESETVYGGVCLCLVNFLLVRLTFQADRNDFYVNMLSEISGSLRVL